MAKMMSPNTTIWWVTAPAYNPDAPSAALLTAAANISCAVVSGYTLNPTDSDTDDSTSICDGANTEVPTYYNYEGNITFFREGDLVNTTSDYAKAFAFFKQRGAATGGYLVRRIGYLSTVAAAAGQVVSSFKFINDNPQDVVEDGGPIEFTVPFLPQGKMSLNVTLVA
jgi:hypothetical protein